MWQRSPSHATGGMARGGAARLPGARLPRRSPGGAGGALLCVLAPLVLSACSTEVSSFEAFGTYTLVTIDGSPPPVSIEDGTQVTSGSLAINDQGECESVVSATPPGGAGVQPRVACTWSRVGTSMTVVWPDGSPSFGSLVADTLTVSVSGTTPGCPPVPNASCSPSDWRYER